MYYWFYYNQAIENLFLGKDYVINEFVKIIPTPGHTLSDVTVLVYTKENTKVAITGKFYFYILYIVVSTIY